MKRRLSFLAKFIAMPFLLSAIIFTSCEKATDDPIENTPGTLMESLIVPDNFDFATIKVLDINIQALDNSGEPIVFIPIEFYQRNDEGKDVMIYKAMTDLDGEVIASISLASSVKALYIKTDYVGIIDEFYAEIEGNHLVGEIGGVPEDQTTKSVSLINQGYYNTLGQWDTYGVPYYLVSNDYLSSSFLADVNASLPEGDPLPQSHPAYFQTGTQYGIHLTEMADVWVTFVHEGASWTNSLGFYTYTEGYPPASVNDINDLTIIFPNVSYGSGSASPFKSEQQSNWGGFYQPGLQSGNKVYLGTFAAGTVIEWFLVAQGWNNYQDTVGFGIATHYSQSEFNLESTASLRQHNVLLYDGTRDLVLLGFEDIPRDDPSCDHDFNDAIFYASVNPFTAVDPTQLPPIDTPDDTDNDGVSDTFDEYPTDPDRAYNYWFPGEELFGSLAYEDLWPSKGDFDFNDIVVDYQYQVVANASNNLVEMYARYVLRASGASYYNGFGVELPLAPWQITSVTGGNYTSNISLRGANGTELNQSKAVIIAWDNAFDVFGTPGTGVGVNTTPGGVYIEPDTLIQLISFGSNLTLANLGTSPFNPFIFVDGDRTVEVHLMDMEPTDLANAALLGTLDDVSDPVNLSYYKTLNNLPFAIHIPQSFEYPIEKADINTAHLMFDEWAESAGVLYPDWYMDKPGYRNSVNIY